MGKLLAGIDVSGNTKEGNAKFMAIVIGTQEKIDSVFKQSDPDQKYTVKNNTNRNKRISKLRFDSNDILAFCIQIDRKTITDKIKKKIKYTDKSSGKIFRLYNNILLHDIRDNLDRFVNQHNYSLSEICFQSDMDCRNFLKDNGLHLDNPGSAHILSDLVAWANNRNKEPKGVISINPTKSLTEKLSQHLLCVTSCLIFPSVN